MKKLITSSLIALSLLATSVYAKTESMYINGYNEDVTSKTLVSYPPSIYKFISQVGKPNFDIFVPNSYKNNIGIEGRIKPAELRPAANGGFLTITTPKDEYSRITVSPGFDSPKISYTFTDKELLNVELTFELPLKASYAVKDSIADSLSRNGLTRNEKSTRITDDNNQYYVFNDKNWIENNKQGNEIIINLYKNNDYSNFVTVLIQRVPFSKQEHEKMLAAFYRYEKESTLNNLGDLLKVPDAIKEVK